MIYLPLYVLYEYPNIKVDGRRVVFYNVPTSTWYLSDSVDTNMIYENILNLEANYGVEMDPPTTYGKTNENIKKTLRKIYQDLPERICSTGLAFLFVSVIDGKKTRRLQIGVKNKSNLRIMGTSCRDIMNSDSFDCSHLEIPRYYNQPGYPKVGIYDWYVEYMSDGMGFWNGQYTCLWHNTFRKTRWIGGKPKNRADGGNEIYHTEGITHSGGRLNRITVNFEYLSKSMAKKSSPYPLNSNINRVQIDARINNEGQIETDTQNWISKYSRRQVVGINHAFLNPEYPITFPHVNIPDNLRYEPNEKKAINVVEYVIDRYFDTNSLMFSS